jgi:acetoin utilization protein AcuB
MSTVSLKVTTIMTPPPDSVTLDETVQESRRLMVINHLKYLAVLEDNKMVGILTEADFVREVPSETKVAEIMSSPVHWVGTNATVQETARIMTEHRISSVPVLDEHDRPLGLVTANELVKDMLAEEVQSVMSQEVIAIHLAMTENRDREDYWLRRCRELSYRAVITQVGANSERLPVKLRESAIVAAIARGVISESTEEKLAVSNAVRDVYAQLLRVHPGLGGGFKLSVVRGAHRVTVVAFGRCGHALANGPEQIILGYSII